MGFADFNVHCSMMKEIQVIKNSESHDLYVADKSVIISEHPVVFSNAPNIPISCKVIYNLLSRNEISPLLSSHAKTIDELSPVRTLPTFALCREVCLSVVWQPFPLLLYSRVSPIQPCA